MMIYLTIQICLPWYILYAAKVDMFGDVKKS